MASRVWPAPVALAALTPAPARHGAGAFLLQSLVDTMRALALNRQLIKLSLYKWFARTLVRQADALPRPP